MIYDFNYHNPTKIYFGRDSIDYLNKELENYGTNILLVYGFGSIKKIGFYDQVINILKRADKHIYELSGVMPNPTFAKLLEGCKMINDHHIDLILAVGGGSVIDLSKAISASYNIKDPWTYYWEEHNPCVIDNIPVASILTIAGTGSESNGGSVITNEALKLKKGHVFESKVAPKFSILNPEITYSISIKQLKSTSFDILSHLMEQYFSGHDDNVSDYLLEALMKVVIKNLPLALNDLENYEVRSNLMWASTMALNKITGVSKKQDWNVHCLEHQLGAYTDCSHGLGLAVISRSYYRHLLVYAPDKFKRFATNVFGIDDKQKSDLQLAHEGIDALLAFLDHLEYPTTLRQLGCTEEMLSKIAESSDSDGSDYHQFTSDEYLDILKEVF
ncbi:MAG: iron-containing alcohol dehydrogenase [Erysipelotrichaceae bacterium]|nr:iron-containing alcohol dehydrogenase [Erysipelotrichaceae bacterium]